MPVEPVIVCSVMAEDPATALRTIAGVPRDVALVELRADALGRDGLRRSIRQAGRPLIVTIRPTAQGGRHQGGEAARLEALREALELGAAFVDVELGTRAAELAEGAHADRVILSHHGGACAPAALEASYAAMRGSGAARLKIVPQAAAVSDALAVRGLLRRAAAERRALACFASGRAGAVTRLLGPAWGSWATYGCPEPGMETAAGQFTATDLLDTHGVLAIGPRTRRFALIGRQVFGSPSPAMHRAGYRAAHLDARYLPVEVDAVDDFLRASGRDGLDLSGFAVTMPFKREVARHCRPGDAGTRDAGAVNTVRVGDDGLVGYDTDGPAARGLIEERIALTGARAAVVGAGGTARAIAASLRAGGARVTLFSRDTRRGGRLARELGVEARALAELASSEHDVLVNATPLGRRGERLPVGDRPRARLVLDAVYAAGPTPLVAAAKRCGIAAIDGMQLLVAQATAQFRHLTGVPVAPELMAAAGMQWLRRSEP